MSGLDLGDVYQAGNGKEGLDAARENWVDLVVADINMPVMNGEEMIDQMKADPELSALPTIVISTEGSATRIQRLEKKGVTFIHKPFTPEIIRDAIQDLTGITGIGDSDESGAF
jgi:two-component system chemotaxis response regulator CheY